MVMCNKLKKIGLNLTSLRINVLEYQVSATLEAKLKMSHPLLDLGLRLMSILSLQRRQNLLWFHMCLQQNLSLYQSHHILEIFSRLRQRDLMLDPMRSGYGLMGSKRNGEGQIIPPHLLQVLHLRMLMVSANMMEWALQAQNLRIMLTTTKKQQVEIDPEKQKLAASLFGGSSKTDKRPSSTSHKSTKASSHVVENSQEAKSVAEMTPPAPPPPDLLDLGEPDNMGSSSSVIDPFTQLEGLLEQSSGSSSTNNSNSVSSTVKESDLLSPYGDIPMSTHSGFVDTLNKDDNLLFGSSTSTNKNGHTLHSQGSKGPNMKDALQKDALVRQMGVTPTSQNPNLFKDLFG